MNNGRASTLRTQHGKDKNELPQHTAAWTGPRYAMLSKERTLEGVSGMLWELAESHISI